MLVSKYIISSEGVQHFIEEYLFQHKIMYTSVLCCVSLMSRFMMKNVTVIKFKKCSNKNIYQINQCLIKYYTLYVLVLIDLWRKICIISSYSEIYIHCKIHVKIIRSKPMRKSLMIIAIAIIAIMLECPAGYAAKDTKSLYTSAAAKFKKNNFMGAIEDYTKAIEQNPKDSYAYLHRGIVKGTESDDLGAIADYNKAIELDPKNSLAYSNRGIEIAKKGDYAGAISDYSIAIKLNPKYAIAYNNRGNAKAAIGDFTGAIEDYTRAIELQQNYGVAYTNRGTAKGHLGDKDGALADYKKAAKLNEPDSKQWLSSRGFSLE